MIGLLWLFLAVDVALVAVGAYAGAAWWPVAAVVTVMVSLVLCLLAWPDSMFGAFVNIGTAVSIVIWRVALG